MVDNVFVMGDLSSGRLLETHSIAQIMMLKRCG